MTTDTNTGRGRNIHSIDKEHDKPYEALQVEYRNMASWYDWFWADYLNKTLPLPLGLVRNAIVQQQQQQHQQQAQTQTQQQQPTVVVVVDVGCGTGEFLKRLHETLLAANRNKKIDLYGIEPSQEMLQQAKTKCPTNSTGQDHNNASPIQFHWMQSTAESIPLSPSMAHVVCSTNAFHFFRHKPTALQQLYQLLCPSSSLIITDWCADYWIVRLYHFVEYLRWNLVGRFADRYPGPLTSVALYQLVQDAGFVNVKIQTYRVRVFGFFGWGMQTITATKPT